MSHPAPGAETLTPDEPQLIETIVKASVDMHRRDYPAGTAMPRDAHPKHHGVVRAELTVDANLPPELRVGLFREPRTYRAYIRFSNGAPEVHKPDAAPDVRGMAIKLLDVDGDKLLEEERTARTHDLLLCSGPVFFVKDLPAYVDLLRAIGSKKLLSFFFPGANPLRWRLRELNIIRKMYGVKAPSPLAIQYWSAVPYGYGPNRAARFSARPVDAAPPGIPPNASPNYLREAMSAHLRDRAATFDLLVQLQTDPASMPIEDSRLAWDSPYRKVATLRIPPQSFESAAQMAFAENLSFTPWHAIPEHRPLGNMNRCRKNVYETMSKLRHEQNGAPRQEPTGDETFA